MYDTYMFSKSYFRTKILNLQKDICFLERIVVISLIYAIHFKLIFASNQGL